MLPTYFLVDGSFLTIIVIRKLSKITEQSKDRDFDHFHRTMLITTISLVISV